MDRFIISNKRLQLLVRPLGISIVTIMTLFFIPSSQAGLLYKLYSLLASSKTDIRHDEYYLFINKRDEQTEHQTELKGKLQIQCIEPSADKPPCGIARLTLFTAHDVMPQMLHRFSTEMDSFDTHRYCDDSFSFETKTHTRSFPKTVTHFVFCGDHYVRSFGQTLPFPIKALKPVWTSLLVAFDNDKSNLEAISDGYGKPHFPDMPLVKTFENVPEKINEEEFAPACPNIIVHTNFKRECTMSFNIGMSQNHAFIQSNIPELSTRKNAEPLRLSLLGYTSQNICNVFYIVIGHYTIFGIRTPLYQKMIRREPLSD